MYYKLDENKNAVLCNIDESINMFNDVINGIKDMAALGLYSYLASKPAGWKINKKQLMKHFDCGRDRLDSAIKKLKELGLIEGKSFRNEKGQISDWQWLLKRHIPKVIDDNTTSMYNDFEKNIYYNRVAIDTIDNKVISTVFLATNHNYGTGKPLLFETMVFCDDYEAVHQYCERYSTWDEAVEGHKRIVQWVKDGCISSQ